VFPVPGSRSKAENINAAMKTLVRPFTQIFTPHPSHPSIHTPPHTIPFTPLSSCS
jgi:hypothetical protein